MAMTTACDSAMTAISFRWFIFRVEPLETRSTMMSATPRCGVISAAPEISVDLHLLAVGLAKNFLVMFGKEVATMVPSLTSSDALDAQGLRRRHGKAAVPEVKVMKA